MKHTQRLIIITGRSDNLPQIKKLLGGFHACTIIKKLEKSIIDNVFYHNKNAVFFEDYYDINQAKSYNPIVLKLNAITDFSNELLGTSNILEDFPKILEKYEIDVGDHESQDSSGMSNVAFANDCLLCKIYNRQVNQIEHIVYESNSFYVVPGTGAFFDGYLMIVPKRHLMSFALLTIEELEEFFSLLDDLRTILEGIYGKKIFAFECGSGRTGAGKHKTSIVHAHFHLAPTNMPVLEEIQKSGIHPALISKEQLVQYGEYPYMLYVDQEDNWFIASDPHDYYPRQHPRQVLANYMGDYAHYNWRKYPYRERMDVIAEQFRSFCKTNFSVLPKWVQKCIRFDD